MESRSLSSLRFTELNKSWNLRREIVFSIAPRSPPVWLITNVRCLFNWMRQTQESRRSPFDSISAGVRSSNDAHVPLVMFIDIGCYVCQWPSSAERKSRTRATMIAFSLFSEANVQWGHYLHLKIEVFPLSHLFRFVYVHKEEEKNGSLLVFCLRRSNISLQLRIGWWLD